MEHSDRKAFLETVIGFAELKGKQLSAPALELYWEAMKSWPLADFKAAAQHLLKTCEFMPVPKDFEDLRRKGEPTAGEAWDAVFLKRGVITERAKKAAHIAASGRYLGHLDLEREVPHVQRRFIEIYNELTDVEQAREGVPQIAQSQTKGLTNVGQLSRQLSRTLAENVKRGNGGALDREDARQDRTDG